MGTSAIHGSAISRARKPAGSADRNERKSPGVMVSNTENCCTSSCAMHGHHARLKSLGGHHVQIQCNSATQRRLTCRILLTRTKRLSMVSMWLSPTTCVACSPF